MNSFPQLCINLANERLHNLFIDHVFEVEARVYAEEDIEWTPTEYADNKPIIDLIVRKGGILAQINEYLATLLELSRQSAHAPN